jgi:hypothetical protein
MAGGTSSSAHRVNSQQLPTGPALSQRSRTLKRQCGTASPVRLRGGLL